MRSVRDHRMLSNGIQSQPFSLSKNSSTLFLSV